MMSLSGHQWETRGTVRICGFEGGQEAPQSLDSKSVKGMAVSGRGLGRYVTLGRGQWRAQRRAVGSRALG